jgi:carboxypeptidase T
LVFRVFEIHCYSKFWGWVIQKFFYLTLIFISLGLASNLFSQEFDKNKPQYKNVQEFMKNLAAQNPSTTEVFNLGLNNTGEMIQGLKIGSGPVNDLVVGTHHGNEFASTEVARGFASLLAAEPIPERTVYVIPVLNVSGYNARQRAEKGLDPNRDYPSPCKTGANFKLKSTKLLADFIEEKKIVASATLHTFSEMVLYPWGISTKDTDTRYTEFFKKLGSFAAYFSQYAVLNSTDALYPADGTFEDYAFWKTGAWSLLFEMGKSHNPAAEQVQEIVAANAPGLKKFIENSPTERAEHHAFEGVCGVRGPMRTHLE